MRIDDNNRSSFNEDYRRYIKFFKKEIEKIILILNEVVLSIFQFNKLQFNNSFDIVSLFKILKENKNNHILHRLKLFKFDKKELFKLS